MRRRPVVPPRRAFFIGVEGRSDEAFIALLQWCCDQEGLHVHLSASAAGGGGSLAVIEDAGRALVRSSSRRQFADRLVLLDADRIEQDLREGDDASVAAGRYGLRLVYLRPNLEGLLFRLHSGRERSRVTARHALQELQKLWPEYRKPPTADALTKRFMPDDLKRAALHDDELGMLLRTVGLMA